ncbi:hypothetical protein BpHYR1_030709, partial [Brachionus plicatilis]
SDSLGGYPGVGLGGYPGAGLGGYLGVGLEIKKYFKSLTKIFVSSSKRVVNRNFVIVPIILFIIDIFYILMEASSRSVTKLKTSSEKQQ